MADERTTVRVTRGFLSKPEKIYDAWLTPAIATKFLFSTPDGEMQKVEIDAKEGGTFTVIEKRKGEDVEHTGTYQNCSAPTASSSRSMCRNIPPKKHASRSNSPPTAMAARSR